MLGKGTSREAVILATFLATLLAPFLTGIALDVLHDGGRMPLASGAYAFVGAIFLMPMTMAFVGLAVGICGRLACACGPWSVPMLMFCTSAIGLYVGLFEFEAFDRPRSWLMLTAFLTAGATTGAAHAALIVFWDRLLKRLAQ